MRERTIAYLRLADIRGANENPKKHDAVGIAGSISEFGLGELPLLDERTDRIVAGHGRIDDLRERQATGSQPPPDIRVDDDGEWLVPVQAGWSSADDAHARAYVAASNKLTETGGWDTDLLGPYLQDLDADGLLELTGFTDADLAVLLDEPASGGGGDGLTDLDDIPEEADGPPISRAGDLWELGPHRLIVGDTTDPAVLRRLLEGVPAAVMVHADPPYGMGKQSEGILNDNLYREKLDAFQNAWWGAWLPHLTDNASAYVWGNAADLWRWWYGVRVAAPAGQWMLRNELVWDKGNVQGMATQLAHSYPCATERCLFLMRGEQFLGNQNADDFYEGYEPLRAHMAAQRDQAGWVNSDVNRITGTNMAGHWMSRSQFTPIARKQYDALRTAAAGAAFVETYDELFDRMYPQARNARRDLAEQMRQTRTPFDNTHDAMTDVWRFGRVTGDERFGHATPKPVDMITRAIATSSCPGDTIAVPFAGTGPEFIAAHKLGGDRVVAAAELHPPYADIICRRWQAHTGVAPIRDGHTVDFTAPAH